MHDRASTSRNRRRSPSGPPTGSRSATNAAPTLLERADPLEPADHVGFPRLIGRRARWVTSRLRQR
jgi:hypothetical protein